MAQTNYTPIQLYYSTTAAAVPTSGNLANGELAINIQDEKLYFKNAAGTVKLLASNATSAPVTSFQTSLGGLTPSTSTTGAITLAGTLNTSSGGTGLTSFTAGDITYYVSGTALSKLAIGTSNQVLTSSGTAPQWTSGSSISVGTATNLAGGATGSVPYQSSSGTTTFLSAGTNGYVLTLAGGVPTWAANTGISTGKSIAMAMIFGG
jgi:hypothetical protein